MVFSLCLSGLTTSGHASLDQQVCFYLADMVKYVIPNISSPSCYYETANTLESVVDISYRFYVFTSNLG